jgi:hypothetical protein
MKASIFPDLAPPLEAALFAGFAPAPVDALEPRAWTPEVARLIARRRLSEHGLWVARRYSIDLPTQAHEILEDATREEALVALRVRSIGPELQKILTDEGIDSMGIKGSAIVDLHGEQLPRYYGDVDLLVAPHDFARAIATYERNGYKPIAGVTPWARKFGGSANLTRGAGREVDVQRVIRPWCWGGRLEFAELRARGRVVNDMRVLGLADALVASAIAQIADTRSNSWKVVPWRDLVVLSAAAAEDEVVAIARQARLSAVVAAALAALPAAVRPSTLLTALETSGRMALPTRVRFAAFASAGWTENWFVRILREVPAGRVPFAAAALAVLPPADMTTREWWRHGTKVFERRRQRALRRARMVA